MFRSSIVRWLLGAVAVVAMVTLLRFKPWQHKDAQQGASEWSDRRAVLKVGFLPVTCHLTCPVTDFASKASKSTRFESQRFTDFPTMAESIKALSCIKKPLFMIAPTSPWECGKEGVPVKILYLGHRDRGSEVSGGQEHDHQEPARSSRQNLRRIPSRYSNQNLVIHKLMEDQGVKPEEIKFVEMPPPDMPGALAGKAIDAYFVGEPFAAKAELDGSGRVLYYAKDIWPHFISCVLVVHEKLIKEQPVVVADLVRGIAQSGEWAETHRVDAAKVVHPYFRQDEKLIRYVLTEPPDRVSYRMLNPTDQEMERIRDMGIKAGILTTKVEMKDLLDRSFIPTDIKAADIDMTNAGQPN